MNKLANKTIPLATILVIAIGMKLWHRNTEADDLYFLLLPIHYGVELLSGTRGYWITHQGFYFPQADFIIDKSCSGFNLLVIMYSGIGFVGINQLFKKLHMLLWVPFSIVIAYALSIAASVLRINQTPAIQPLLIELGLTEHMAHESIGITTNLLMIAAGIYIINFYFSKAKTNA